MEKKRIAVLGAGFGGLRAATQIAKKISRLKLLDQYEITLIDRNEYQIYTPTLYEVATTSKETADYIDLRRIVTFPVRDLIRNYPITFLHATLHEIDLKNGMLYLSGEQTVRFDYLVLALGSETNYFNIPGLQQNALPLKTFHDALQIRNRIISAVQDKEHVRVVVGGGGSTGVELAGEIEEWLCELREEIKKCKATVTLVEAAPRLLSGFDERLVARATARLKKLGVEILTNEVIAEANAEHVTLKSGRKIPYDVLIWTGGIKASSLTHALPLKTEEKRRQVVASSSMECLPETPDLKLYGKIYGLGDAICFFDPLTEQPIPKVARAALIQADVVAHNIAEDIKAEMGAANKPRHKTYAPKRYPYVIPVGGKYAIAKIGTLIISGFFGWVLKGLVELNYLLSIMPFWKAIGIWLKGLRIFIQNDRLG